MDFSVKIEGLDRLDQAMKGVPELVDKEVRTALYACAQRVDKEAKQSIANGEGKRGGRFYKRGNVLHQASAPGEPPSTDTGRLVNSITAYRSPHDKLEATVVAGRGTVNYAAMLEFGTRYMAARPFMFPALERSREWIRERLAKAVRTAAIKSTRK